MRVVAPGRVNIIGEHVDHQNYAVLPCAIEKNITADADYFPIEAGPALTLEHNDPTTYPTKVFEHIEDIKIGTHSWSNYVVAAYLGIVEYLSLNGDVSRVGYTIDPKNGLTTDQISAAGERSPTKFSIKLKFNGNIPPGAGLSSSSALVVCSAFAISLCAGKESAISALDMAGLCTNAERYVGTAGGGMDQAAICLSQAGKAQHINFRPLNVSPVQLPENIALVIANTCREAPKVRDAAKMYNKRVFELKTACLALISKIQPDKAKALSGEDVIDLTLRDVLRGLKVSEQDLLDNLSTYIEQRPHTKHDVDAILGSERREILLKKRCGEGVWTQNEEFFLFERIRHVLTETMRVDRFVELCGTSVKEGCPTDKTVTKELGKLLNGSQQSLKEDFDCSCPEIDELCSIALKNGALGSRLTGAGWGGCTVSMILKEDTDKFLNALKEQYFEPFIKGQKTAHPPLEHLPDADHLAEALFVTCPGPAAHIA